MLSDCSRLKIVQRTFFRHFTPADAREECPCLSDEDVRAFNEAFDPKSTSARIGDRYRVIICHANIIRYFACMALGIGPEGTWGRMRYNHCGVTEIDIDSVGNLQLGYINQTSHLPPTMLSEL